MKNLGEYKEYVLVVSSRGFNRFVLLMDPNEAPPETITLEEESISDEPLLEKSEAHAATFFRRA